MFRFLVLFVMIKTSSFFLIDNKILYRRKINHKSTLFVSRKMCVSQSMIKDILIITYDESNERTEFYHIYDRVINL